MFVESHLGNRDYGWIEVICGSMFSGKTEELIRRLKRAKIANLDVEIFKPLVDTRYDENKVVSHDDNFIHSTPVKNSKDIIKLAHSTEVIGIDEAQFFDEDLPEVCNILANRGARVIVAGLDMDFSGKPFGPMPNLLAIAEYVTKVHAICTKTRGLANYSLRLSDDDDLVQLGEKDVYEPVSRKVFWKEMRKRQAK